MPANNSSLPESPESPCPSRQEARLESHWGAQLSLGPNPGATLHAFLARALTVAVALPLLTVPTPAAAHAPLEADPLPLVAVDHERAAAQHAARILNRRVAPPPAAVAVKAIAKPAVKQPVKPAAKKPAPKLETFTVPASGRGAAIVAYARSKVGGRYVWGAAGPSVFDCSGLVMMALRQVGISVPHQSGAIAARGRRVPTGQWMPGDIIVSPGHVAVYAGGGKMIEAANPRAGIRIAPVRGGYAVRFV